MTDDLRTQLARYGAQIRDDHEVLTVDDVANGGEPSVVVGRTAGRVTARWRPGLALGAALLTVLAIGFLPLVLSRDRPEVAETSSLEPASDLGVFEPIRGWIIYPKLGSLEAVDPDNPTGRHTLDLPWKEAGAVPVGWSADGSLLALTDEHDGHWYVMDRFGELRFRGDTAGCCLFVSSNWLSPDGTFTFGGPPGGLSIVELDGGASRRLLDLDQLGDVLGIRAAAWSSDGSAVAFAPEREWGMTLAVVDVESGAIREVVPSSLGYVRHIAWSPDGSQLLVTAADLACCDPDYYPPLNPLANPVSSRLYLVNVDGSGLQEIASGDYVATAWSPDGAQIAALDYTPEGRRVAVMERDGSGLRALPDVAPSGPFTGIAWHPAP